MILCTPHIIGRDRMAISKEDFERMCGQIMEGQKNIESKLDLRAGGLEQRVDAGLSNLQQQIDAMKEQNIKSGAAVKALALSTSTRMGAGSSNSGFSNSQSGASVASSDGTGWAKHDFKVMVFGLGDPKSKAQLIGIANESMRVHGIHYTRVMATSGRNFFSMIMPSVEDVDKLCSGRVEVRFCTSIFNIEAKPDRAPRSVQQKAGGRVTNQIFKLVTQFAATIQHYGTPALGSYKRDSENKTYKRQLMLEPTVCDDQNFILPLFEIVYQEDGSYLAVTAIDEAWVGSHAGYRHWHGYIMAAIADVNNKFSSRTAIAKYGFLRKKALFPEEVPTPAPKRGAEEISDSAPAAAALASSSPSPATPSAANGTQEPVFEDPDPDLDESGDKGKDAMDFHA